MLYSVRGKLIHMTSNCAVVECGGVGFNCQTTINTLKTLRIGSEVTLFTYLNVREDAMELFGFASKTELDTFLEICGKPVEGTVLLISLPSNTPKDKTISAIIKAIGKKGAVCEFQKPNAMTLEKFIAKWANANGKLISRAAAKICSYSGGEEVSLEDIDKLATVNLESRIFDLSDAVLAGNGEKAFRVLDLLFYQKEEPIVMLYTLSNAYIDAYRVRVASECGVINTELAADFSYGKRTFLLDRVKRSTNRVSTEALRKSLDLLMDADLKFKSVRLNERLYLEQLIAQLLLTAREGRR